MMFFVSHSMGPLHSFHLDEFEEKFSKPTIRISMAFTKDIVSRFSSYYARQGQPVFDADTLILELQTEDS